MQEHNQVEVVMKATQGGYPLAIDTPVPTPQGWTTMQDIKVGQSVFGSDGRAYHVQKVYDIKHNQSCYRVIFSDESSIVCDGEHLWTFTDEWNYRYKKQVTLRTSDILAAEKRGKRNRYVLPVASAIKCEEKILPIPPYILGYWLGNGNSYSAQVTCHTDDAHELGKIMSAYWPDLEVRQIDVRSPNTSNIKFNNMHGVLRKAGLINNKHVPADYMRSAYWQRLELLQGLMDSDGTIDKRGKCEFYNINLSLIRSVKELFLSLGVKANYKIKCLSNNWDRTIVKDYPIYRVHAIPYKDVPVFRLKRKKLRQRCEEESRSSETLRRRVVRVEPVKSVPVRCIAVDSPNHLFLAGEDFIPVHNTEQQVLDSLHSCIYNLVPKGILYLFPTEDDVLDFSKTRFNTLIHNNPVSIGQHVKAGGKGTDSASLKKVGSSFIYFRSGKLSRSVGDATNKEASQLRSIPVDRIVYDEYDLMDEEICEKARGRLGHSALKQERYLSNPTLPGYGIDRVFQQSDQRHWFRKCASCQEWTCAELEFPQCVKRGENGKGYIACVKCGRPVSIYPGEWVAAKKDMPYIGRQWSQLTSIYNDPWDILHDYYHPKDGKLDDVMRLRLGQPYVSLEDKLRVQEVYNACTGEMQMPNSETPCAMGVDIGKIKHVVIGQRRNAKQSEIIRVARVDTFNDIHDLARRYNVRSAVIDIRPYEDEARKFQKDEPYLVYLCEYTDNALQDQDNNDKTKTLKAHRTGLFDLTGRMVREGGFIFPRRDKDIDEFAAQLCNTAKRLELKKQTSTEFYRYVKLGDEHYRNALNYFYLASLRAPVVQPRGMRRELTAECVMDYNVMS